MAAAASTLVTLDPSCIRLRTAKFYQPRMYAIRYTPGARLHDGQDDIEEAGKRIAPEPWTSAQHAQ